MLARSEEIGFQASKVAHLLPRTPRRRVRIPRNVDLTTLPKDAELMGRSPKSWHDMVYEWYSPCLGTVKPLIGVYDSFSLGIISI